LLDWGIKFIRAANAEHVRRCAPVIRDLSLASRACFEEFAALPGLEFGLTKQGLLMLCQQPHTLAEEAKTAERAQALGIPAEVLDAAQTAALDSAARMSIAGAVYFPLDCHLSPAQFMLALQRELSRLGVDFLWGCEARQFVRPDDTRLAAVRLENGETVAGDEFVLCGGAWSPALTADLGIHLPMQAGKGYSLTLTHPRRLPRICSILTEARVAVTPMGGALRVGGTMEIAGMNEAINPIRVRGIVDAFCRYYPEFTPRDFDGIQPWHGLRPCSPDGMPYVGRTRRRANLALATGHAMMGLSLGPVTGRIIAELLAGEPPAFDLTLLSPDRYA
jgi:D-amino-acid dehydrogenase